MVMLTPLEIWLLDVAIALTWLLLVVNYHAYRLLGRDEFSDCEIDPIFSFLVRHLGGWAFIVASLLTPFIILLAVAVTSEPYRPVTCGIFIGIAASALFYDVTALRDIHRALKAEEALNGPEVDLVTISVPEEHRQRYCERLECERISSFRWLGGNWICCGIAHKPSKPGDVIITCQGVVRGDKLYVITVEQRPDEAAIMGKVIQDALTYYLNEEAWNKYGIELEEVEEDEGEEKEA